MIQCIYFDLGGVVIKDFSCTDKWLELKKEIGIAPDQYEAFDIFFKPLEKEVCVGRNLESLQPLLSKEFGVTLSKGYSFLNGFVSRFEKNDLIEPIILEAKKYYKIGLLTNAYPGMLDMVRKNNLLPSISWDVIIDSSVVGLRKPQQEIYEFAQEKAGVRGDEILFVENSKIHVDAAAAFGWNAFFYDSCDYVKASKDLTKRISDLVMN